MKKTLKNILKVIATIMVILGICGCTAEVSSMFGQVLLFIGSIAMVIINAGILASLGCFNER